MQPSVQQTSITIRPARVSDASALCAAEQAIAVTPGLLVSAPDELVISAFTQKIEDLSRKGAYLVAETEGHVCGHLLLDPLPLKAVAHVFRLTVVVHLGHQGKGLGRRLMQAALDWAQAHHELGKIELMVRSTNDRAIHLYRAMGFVEEGRFVRRIKLPDGHYADDLAMAWRPTESSH